MKTPPWDVAQASFEDVWLEMVMCGQSWRNSAEVTIERIPSAVTAIAMFQSHFAFLFLFSNGAKLMFRSKAFCLTRGTMNLL